MAVFPWVFEAAGPFNDVQYHGVFGRVERGVIKLPAHVLRKEVAVGDPPGPKIRNGVAEADGLNHGVVATKLAVGFLEVPEHSVGAVQTPIAVAFVAKPKGDRRVVAWGITSARE